MYHCASPLTQGKHGERIVGAPSEFSNVFEAFRDEVWTKSNEDFRRATTSLFTLPERKLNMAQITDTGRQLHNHYTAPVELKQTRMEWSDFLNRSPERYQIRLPELPENKDLHYSGYSVRYMRPEVTASWKYTLRQEPTLDQYSQKPIPANVYARYRDTYPQYSQKIATEAWR